MDARRAQRRRVRTAAPRAPRAPRPRARRGEYEAEARRRFSLSRYELYATLASTADAAELVARCQALARAVKADEARLFALPMLY